ncbi:hypothetical protein HZS_2468, partial [Henneguya salminicola]
AALIGVKKVTDEPFVCTKHNSQSIAKWVRSNNSESYNRTEPGVNYFCPIPLVLSEKYKFLLSEQKLGQYIKDFALWMQKICEFCMFVNFLIRRCVIIKSLGLDIHFEILGPIFYKVCRHRFTCSFC